MGLDGRVACGRGWGRDPPTAVWGRDPPTAVAGQGRVTAAIAWLLRDQTRTLELLLRPPARPTVPRSALEGAVLPRRQAQPTASEGRHITKAAACQTAKAQIMIPVHQHVPVRTLLRLHQTYLHLRQRIPFRCLTMDRARPLADAFQHPPGRTAPAQERRCLTQTRPPRTNTQRGIVLVGTLWTVDKRWPLVELDGDTPAGGPQGAGNSTCDPGCPAAYQGVAPCPARNRSLSSMRMPM